MSKNYVELKVSELRDECKNRSLDTSGLKVHLVERLNKYDREQLIKNKTEVKTTTISTTAPVIAGKKEETIVPVHPVQNNLIVGQTSIDNKTPVILNVEDKVISKEDRKRPHPSELTESKKENLFNLASNELDNWESRTDVHMDFYNSDINLVIDEKGYHGTPLFENGFEYMCAGVKGNYGYKSGKIFFEVKILKKLKVELNNDAGESNFIRIGWSTDNESLALGEGTLSFGYDGIGKKLSEGNFSDYGVKFDEGCVVGCFLEFNGDCFVIRYSVNGVNQGEAFNILSRELKEHMLVPHIYTKNVMFEVNFGQNDCEPYFSPKTETEESQPIEDLTWTLLGKVNLNQRTRALMPPKAKSDCEVLMMCGLPGCGKTNWTEKQTKEHPEKRFNVLSVNTILEKMKVINLRKKVSSSRWDSFISYATNCLNKLMEIAVSRRRNFILDQTNVYPSAQRRRMKPFEEFIRKAIIIVPTDDEYQRRMNQVIQEEGKDVPESAVLQLKENFVIPEENSDLFNEIIFIELQRPEAEELIKKYNEEAKNHNKKDTNSDGKPKRNSDDESYGKWSTSPKETSEDNEPTAPKKSRWNDQIENRKDSKNRERHDRSSPERLPRKNDYKGGFCFSREASDSGKGGSNRFNDTGFRSEDRHNDKSRDQRGERSGNKSNAVPYRKSGDNNDRRPKFDRDESKFGNRNPMIGNRDSRPRDRGSESRGGSQFQGRDRPRGGYNDRRPVNSYDDGDSRNKFPQSNYNDRSGMNNQDRNNRFPQNMPERTDFRGRGRGAPVGNQNASFGKEPFVDRRSVPENREYQNYSEYNPYPDNRQTNMPWQPDYKNDAVENTRRTQGFDNSNRGGNLPSNYDQQFGNTRGAVGLPISRGKSNEKMPNQYNERKTTNVRGGQSNRGRAMAPLIDIPQNDDYSYGSNKNYDAPVSKFGNKPHQDLSMGGYKEPPRPEMAYNSSKTNRGGYSKFGETQKSANAFEVKGDNSSRDYTGMLQTTPYESYQSYDNSQYNQNQGYYNYYTGDSSKEQTVGAASNVSTINSTSRAGYQSAYPSGNLTSGSNYQSSTHPSSNSIGGGGYQSSNPTSGAAYQSSNYPSNNTTSGSSGYQSNYLTTGTGYQPNYQSSNPTSGGTGYQSNYQSSNPTSGTGYQSSYQSSNPTSGTGYQSSYQSSNPTSGTGYQSSYQSSNPTSGTGYQSNYQSSNPTSGTGYQSTYQSSSGSNYTNPYNAIYENTSSYNSSYYGQTNTYAQSGNYGENTVTSKFSEYSSKPPSDRSIPPPAVTTPQTASTGQTQASWGTGYGDYSQYYGQYYGN